MEIEVGEYVRTKNNGIKKIDHLAVNPNVTVNKYRYFLGYDEDGDRCYGVLKTTDIVNHSFNIIDLIQEGDYINGELVIEITKNYITIGKITYAIKDLKGIKKIVTREQFSSVEYLLEEE